MTDKMLTEEGASVNLSVVVSARGKVAIFAFEANSDRETPILTTEANLNDDVDRARIVGALPIDSRAEAVGMLLRLAAGVAAARLTRLPKGKGAPVVDPFPTLEPWVGAIDGAQLLDELCALLARYVVLPAHADVAIALWLVHTYAIAVADYTPYLLLTSPVRECGKSTLLELLSHLAFRAQMTSGFTAAALYRKISRDAPTMLLDEIDARLKNGDASEAIRGVLNSGFHRTGRMTICVGDDHETKDFSTYCAKVLAGIGKPWDTVTSRSIPIPLNRASKAQIAKLTKIRGDRIGDVCLPYCRRVATFVAAHATVFASLDPVAPAQLGARQADVWRPLLAIADTIGGEWPQRARTAAIALHGAAQSETDVGLLILEDVRALFATHGTDGKLASATIVEELVKREDRPWPEYRNDRPLTTRGVSVLLGRFGVKPKNVRAGHGAAVPVVKGYELEDLRSAFATYLPPLPSDLTATSATAAPLPSVQPVADAVAAPLAPSATAVTDPLRSPSVADVAVRKDGRGPPQRTAYNDGLTPKSDAESVLLAKMKAQEEREQAA